MTAPDAERKAAFRHDFANPLAALLAEIQLLLLSDDDLAPAVRSSLQEMEKLALRMRMVLKDHDKQG